MQKDVLQRLAALGIETNANEVMNTGATGYGAELVPSAEVTTEIMESFRTYSTFVNALPGYHGTGLGKSVEVDIIGEVPLFQKGAEKTTGAFALAQGTGQLGTGQVTLNQKKYELTVDISDELAQFNRLGAAEFERRVREKLGKAGARTIEHVIINGDTETGATGNVNSDDGAPASTQAYLHADGLRKTSIVTSSTTVNCGTLDFADFLSVMGKVGDFAADPADCLWLFNRATFNKALGLDQFQDESKNGKQSVIHTGALTNILGSDLFIARDLAKTEADGKISTTAGNNTLGQFIYFWKPAVQFGFGGDGLKMKLFDMGKDGYQLQAWFYMGLAIVEKKAGQTDSSVGTGINVTVA